MSSPLSGSQSVQTAPLSGEESPVLPVPQIVEIVAEEDVKLNVDDSQKLFVPDTSVIYDRKTAGYSKAKTVKLFPIGTHVPENDSFIVTRSMFNFLKHFQSDSAEEGEKLKLFVLDDSSDEEIESDIVTQSLSSRMNVATNFLKSKVHGDLIEFSEFLLDAVILVEKILSTTDPSVIPTLIYSFLRIQGVGAIESQIISFLARPFVWAKTNIVTNSLLAGLSDKLLAAKKKPLSEHVDDLGDLMEYVFDSAFADACKNVIVAGAILKFTDAQTAFTIFRVLGKPVATTMFDIVRGAIKSIAVIIRALEAIQEGKQSLHTILFSKDPWVMAQNTFATLGLQRTHLRVGLKKPEDGLFDKHNWKKTSKELRKYLTEKLLKTSSAKTKYVTISSMINSLDLWTSEVDAAAGAAYRMTPFAISWHGPPGIGKSSFLHDGAALWCHIRGIEFSQDMIYHRIRTADFFDGYCSQPIGHWSEVGSDAKGIAEKTKDNYSAELTSVIDSIPMQTNQAALDKKGNSWIGFEFVQVDTNNKTMNYDLNSNCAAAYLRRFLHVGAVVKPQYRKKGSLYELDWVAVEDDRNQNGTHEMDLWTFTIEKCLAQGNSQFTFEPCTYENASGEKAPTKDLDYFEYRWALTQLAEAHLRSQEAIMDLKKSGKMSSTFGFKSAQEYYDAQKKVKREKYEAAARDHWNLLELAEPTKEEAKEERVHAFKQRFNLGVEDILRPLSEEELKSIPPETTTPVEDIRVALPDTSDVPSETTPEEGLRVILPSTDDESFPKETDSLLEEKQPIVTQAGEEERKHSLADFMAKRQVRPHKYA